MLKLSRRSFIGCLGSAALPLLINNAKAAKQTIRFSHHDFLRPYSFRIEGRMSGALINTLDKIFEHSDFNLTHQGFPWKRAQNYVKIGAMDAICTNPTAERREYIYFNTIPIIESSVGILHRRKDNRLTNLKTVSDLKDLKIVDYIGNSWIEEKLKGFDINQVHTQEQILNLVRLGRMDATIGCQMNLIETISHFDLAESLAVTPVPFFKQLNFHFGLRKDYPNAKMIVDHIDEVLNKVNSQT